MRRTQSYPSRLCVLPTSVLSSAATNRIPNHSATVSTRPNHHPVITEPFHSHEKNTHIIDVYKENASIYLKTIVEEIERHGGPIDKVRAGYILDEVCELSDPKINGWLQYVQRGGSRKLVANASYSPIFSEKWCISLNLEEV